MTLPDWIDREAWDGYCAMRRLIKKPMTERAKQMAVNRLANLMSLGEDPKAVLEQSEFMGWQGLFAVRKERNGESKQERFERETMEALDRFEAGEGKFGKAGTC